jgi:hypothetical protein
LQSNDVGQFNRRECAGIHVDGVEAHGFPPAMRMGILPAYLHAY